MLKEAINIFGQIVFILLEKHREAVFDALSVTYGIDRQKERNNQATALVNCLHFALHGRQG